MKIANIISVILLFLCVIELQGVFLAVDAVTQPIKLATERDEGGATVVTIKASKIKESGILIRVLPAWEVGKCDPNAAVLPGLDLRDSYSTDRDISPSISGAWSMTDASDGTRKYVGLMSPSRLRQQFISYTMAQVGEQKPLSIGAVTGGAVGATIYACLYKVSGTSIAVLGEATTAFVSESASGEKHVDMSASLLAKVLVVGDGITRSARILVETRTSTTCVNNEELAIDQGMIPSVSHVSSVAHSASLETKEVKYISSSSSHVSAKGIESLCDSVDVHGDSCKVCVRRFEIVSPVELSYPDQMLTAVDIVSRFEIPKSYGASPSSSAKATQFVVRFVIPPTTMCISQDGVTCVPTTADDGTTPTAARSVTDFANTKFSSGVKITSEGKDTSATQMSRDGMSSVQMATMYDGKETCISTNPDTTIQSATLGVCTGSEVCSIAGVVPTSVYLVDSGFVNADLSRFSMGELKKNSDGSSTLCFVPTIGLGHRQLTVVLVDNKAAQKTSKQEPKTTEVQQKKKNGWGIATSSTVDNNNNNKAVKEQQDHHDEDHNEVVVGGGPNQQHHEGNNGGKHVISVEVSFVCKTGEHFDHGRNTCKHDDNDDDDSLSWWLEFIIIASIVLIIIGIIACVAIAFEESLDDEEPQHHHRQVVTTPFILESDYNRSHHHYT